MKRLLKNLIVAALVITMTAGSLFSAYAAKQETYISEVKIAYGDEGKAALQAAGYQVAEYNLNDSASKADGEELVSVWMGYKTTLNADEAITDMAVMNMSGDYSFVEYEKVIEDQKDNIAKMLESYITAIKGFREKYAEGSMAAMYAYEILNLYHEDDTGMLLGDFLLSESVTSEQLQTMFLQSNVEVLALVYNVLAIAQAKLGDDSIVKLLSEASMDDDYPKSLATTNRKVYDAIKDIQTDLECFYEVTERVGFDEDAIEAFLSENPENLSDEILYSISEGYAFYNLAKDIDYADSDMTLLGLVSMDIDEITDYELSPLSASLSKGQVAALDKTGLNAILQAEANTAKDYEQLIKDLEENIKEEGVETTASVYYGVDRSLYEPDGIALTTDAAKSSNNASGSSWTEGDTSDDVSGYEDAMRPLLITGIVTGAIGVVYYVSIDIGFYLVDGSGFFSYACDLISRNLMTKGGYIMAAIPIVLGLVCIASLVYYFVFRYKVNSAKYQDKTYEYSRKPRVMVTEETDDDGETFYGYYYAVRDLDDEIADLNGNDTHNPEWNVLYTTKDSRLGEPLTADIVVQNKADMPKGYTAVHSFTKGAEGVKAAYNLNNKTAQSTKSIYMFVKPAATDSANLTGSIFSTTSGIVSLIAAFVIGLAVSGGVAVAVDRRKRKKQVNS